MRYAASLAAGLLLVVLSTNCLAQPVVVLDEQNPVVDLQTSSFAWTDASGQATIARMTAGKQRPLMSPMPADTIYALGSQEALWQHYRFRKVADSQQAWLLEFPLPLLDRVTVFQQGKGGNWTDQTAGDTVPVADWPAPGRYAQFELALPDDGVHDVYVRIEHVTPVNIPANVVSRKAWSQRLQMDSLVIGVVFGGLLLLIVAGTALGWVHRDWDYGWYAAYAIIMTLVVATSSGIAGHLLWGHFAEWNNAAQGVLGMLGGSAALLVVHKLCGFGSRHRGLDLAVYTVGLAGPGLALAYLGLERQWGVQLLGVYLIAVVMLGMASIGAACLRKDRVAVWVLAAFTPLALATLLATGRVFGWLSTSGLPQHALMLALTIEVPLLLVALNLRSRERHGIQAREQAMASHDALTGLLAPHLFHDRLKQVVTRAQRHREPAAVVYLELVNYRHIKRSYGVAVAEQSLLRSVIKLRRILRDVDTVGRVEEARFGLIMEGVSSREPVTELAARLIAAGLMPLKGLKPEVILEFHVASVLLSERLMESPKLSQALADMLSTMGTRTRRPIRFLEPELTRPMPLAQDSGFGGREGDSLPAT